MRSPRLLLCASLLEVTGCSAFLPECNGDEDCAPGLHCVEAVCAAVPLEDDGGSVVISDGGDPRDAGADLDAGAPLDGGEVSDGGGMEPVLDGGAGDGGSADGGCVLIEESYARAVLQPAESVRDTATNVGYGRAVWLDGDTLFVGTPDIPLDFDFTLPPGGRRGEVRVARLTEDGWEDDEDAVIRPTLGEPSAKRWGDVVEGFGTHLEAVDELLLVGMRGVRFPFDVWLDQQVFATAREGVGVGVFDKDDPGEPEIILNCGSHVDPNAPMSMSAAETSDGFITVAVGAPWSESPPGDAERGEVCVFARELDDPQWYTLQFLTLPADATSDFGRTVKLIDGGETLLVGAAAGDESRAYVFRREDTAGAFRYALDEGAFPHPVAANNLGRLLTAAAEVSAGEGERQLLVGTLNWRDAAAAEAGAVYAYTLSDGSLAPSPALISPPWMDSAFGARLATMPGRAVITSASASAVKASVFSHACGEWSPVGELESASASEAMASFGASVHMDDAHIVVGAPTLPHSTVPETYGAVYIYSRE